MIYIEVHNNIAGAPYHRKEDLAYVGAREPRVYPGVPEGYLAEFIMPPCRSGHSMFVFAAEVDYALSHGLQPCRRCFPPL